MGIGNILMGDDGAGPAAASALASGPLPPGVSVVDAGTALQSCLEEMAGSDFVMVIDAVQAGGPRGTVYAFTLPEQPGNCTEFSAHGYDLYSAVEEAKASAGRPLLVVVFGIEPARLSPGYGLSAPVQEAVRDLVEVLAVELGDVAGLERFSDRLPVLPAARRAERDSSRPR